MKTHDKKFGGRLRRFDPTKARKASPTAKLASLPDDQLALVVAWLFQGRTYKSICALAKQHFGITCSIMAVKTVWDKYAVTEEQMRAERVIRHARIILQSTPQQ